MNLAWCVIALALAGTANPSPSETPPRNARLGIKIEVEFGEPAGQSAPVPMVAHDAAAVIAGSLSCGAAVSTAAVSAPSEICHSTCSAAPAPLAKQIAPVSQEIWPMTLRQAFALP